MRMLHTADWHVGRTIRGRSRAGEHAAVLDEIVRLADAEQVDVVLVAGDQFDVAAPAPDAERIVYRALLDLAETGAVVVVVAGNHDNAQRLEAVAPLLAAGGVRAGARLARPDQGGVVDVATRSGEVARIALLPFVSQRAIVRADDLMALDADEHAGRFDARMRAVIDRLCSGFADDTVSVLLGHLTVYGGQTGGGERAAHVFGYAVPATVFPATAHYVALGHLHRPQRLPAACPVWYAGSPLQLDFGETGDDSAVLLVDVAVGRPAEVRNVPLVAGRRLRSVRGSLEQLEELAAATDGPPPRRLGDHLRVVVVGQARAGLAEQVREWFPDAVEVVVEAADGPHEQGDAPARLGRSPRELFAEYLADRGAVDERVQALFDELLDDTA